jgi:hypothetical protein
MSGKSLPTDRDLLLRMLDEVTVYLRQSQAPEHQSTNWYDGWFTLVLTAEYLDLDLPKSRADLRDWLMEKRDWFMEKRLSPSHVMRLVNQQVDALRLAIQDRLLEVARGEEFTRLNKPSPLGKLAAAIRAANPGAGKVARYVELIDSRMGDRESIAIPFEDIRQHCHDRYHASDDTIADRIKDVRTAIVKAKLPYSVHKSGYNMTVSRDPSKRQKISDSP